MRFLRILRWTFFNGLVAWALWLGYFEGNRYAANAFTFVFWFAVVVGTLAALVTLSKERRMVARKPGVPLWLDHTFDAVIAVALASIGCFAMAGWWMWQAVCVAIIHDKKYPLAEDAK